MKLSEREKKFFNLATIGGKTIEDAYAKSYRCTNRKSLLTSIAIKQKRRPELFDQINSYKNDLFEKAKTEHKKAIIEAAKQNALTLVEKREILRKIISGEQKGEEYLIFKGHVKKIIRDPNINERIRALELDCKIAGHFAPAAITHEASDSFIELMKARANRKMLEEKQDNIIS